jgi:hypothetical protein
MQFSLALKVDKGSVTEACVEDVKLLPQPPAPVVGAAGPAGMVVGDGFG